MSWELGEKWLLGMRQLPKVGYSCPVRLFASLQLCSDSSLKQFRVHTE